MQALNRNDRRAERTALTFMILIFLSLCSVVTFLVVNINHPLK